jgi:hypothetical protein
MEHRRSFGGTVIAQDTSQETTTLQLTGLGDHASFYIGTTQIHGTSGSHSVSYDAGTDTWTIIGLTQNDLDGLGFKQARAAMTDQDTGATGVQIGVKAWTVDGTSVSDSVDTTITTRISPQLSTSSNDTLIWTGNSINGLGGNDTIQLRFGEDLDGSALRTNLKNIEVLDLSIGGANSITNLTAKDVLDMTDSRNTLRINGTAEDEVTLGTWDPNAAVDDDEVVWSTGTTGAGSQAGYTVYTATIGSQLVTLEVNSIIID